MKSRIAYCSFCNKKHDDVRKLFAGSNVFICPGAFICDGCVERFMDIIREESKSALARDAALIREYGPQTA